MRQFLGGCALLLVGFYANQLASKYGNSWGRMAGAIAACIGLWFLLSSPTIRPFWAWGTVSSTRSVVAIIIAFLVTGSLGGLAAFWFMRDAANDPTPASGEAQDEPVMLTLGDLFQGDFPDLLRSHRARKIGITVDGQKKALEITEQLYSDFQGKSKFVGFYIPHSGETQGLCLYLADHVDFPFGLGTSVISGGVVGEELQPKDLVFTGRVFLYHEDHLNIEQQAEIVRAYRERGLSVSMRGPDYLSRELIRRNAHRLP